VLDRRAAESVQLSLREAIISTALTGLPENASVVEVGSGTGGVALAVAGMAGVGFVIGVEPSAYFVAKAKANAHTMKITNVNFVVGEAVPLPVPDASQDMVIMWTLLNHIPGHHPEGKDKRGECLKEAARVLKPKGRVVLFDNDFSGAQFGLAYDDVIQTALTYLTRNLCEDHFLCRKYPIMLAQAGFDPSPLQIHVDVATHMSTHAFNMVLRGISMMASDGVLDAATAKENEMLAKQRVAEKRFHGVLTYGSCIGSRGF